jgi:acetyl esterase
MPLDLQARMVLDYLEHLGLPDVSELDPDTARRVLRERPLPPGPEVAEVRELRIPGPAGEIPARAYWPPGSSPFGCLVFFHGGGFVVCDLETHDALCRQIAVDSVCCVVAVDYRLAPEHRFPAAPDDCYAALCWVADNADRLRVDRGRLAVGGDSAGGNLAAVVSVRARDRGGPQIKFQLLAYPVTDLRSMDTQSHRQFASGYFLTRAALVWFRDHYLQDASQRTDAEVSPLACTRLQDLPPALVITAECDPLRDEGEAYARALEQAGVPTALSRYPGMIHGFLSLYAVLSLGEQAVGEICAALSRALGSDRDCQQRVGPGR